MADQGTGGLLSPFLQQQWFKVVRPYLKGECLMLGVARGLWLNG